MQEAESSILSVWSEPIPLLTWRLFFLRSAEPKFFVTLGSTWNQAENTNFCLTFAFPLNMHKLARFGSQYFRMCWRVLYQYTVLTLLRKLQYYPPKNRWCRRICNEKKWIWQWVKVSGQKTSSISTSSDCWGRFLGNDWKNHKKVLPVFPRSQLSPNEKRSVSLVNSAWFQVGLIHNYSTKFHLKHLGYDPGMSQKFFTQTKQSEAKCVARELNPDLLLVRQRCWPLHQRRSQECASCL